MTGAAPTLLCVHQGYELYGSDRTFISALKGFRARFAHLRLLVVLPQAGPLSAELERLGFCVEIRPLWVARRTEGPLRLLARMLQFPQAVLRARRHIAAAALTYINTSVIFDYALAARLSCRPVLLHVHEIPTGLAMRLIRLVLALSGARLVYNSQATGDAFGLDGAVVLNGIPDPGPPPAAPASDGILNILMIGRINDWKGQDLLVEAVAALPAGTRGKMRLRFAGSAFAGNASETRLLAQVQEKQLGEITRLDGFVDDPAPLYRWADIVAVPSRKPEPFGLVAVEAMAHGKPVLAAAHGGLTEIIEDGETGWLVPPNDAPALAKRLAALAEAGEQAHEMGIKGRMRFENAFSESRYQDRLCDELGALLGPEPALCTMGEDA
ncbi:glycosyltransferase family 4 protein [Devosia sp.]|uniref:glycosyltransferase family 4 protein n=1 Tax=Devosia sp. TaxID=1871048 RepID=UPI002AFF4770|nr:glycosyltransferase family 4 protein [Devosia sp.]